MQLRRNLARPAVVVVALVLAVSACGGGGGAKAASSSSSSTTTTTVPKEQADAYEKALADLGNAFNDASDAFTEVTDATGISAGQPLLRDLRDAWFEFDKKVRALELPLRFTKDLNELLTLDTTVIADLDKFNDALHPSVYNGLLTTLADDIDKFRSQADRLAKALGVEGTNKGSSSSSSSTSSTRSSTGARPTPGGTTPVPLTDAVAARDHMIELAQAPGAVDASTEPAISSWPTAFPGLDFHGSALPASPSSASGFATFVSKTKGVSYLPVALADTSGRCAALVLEFNDAGDTVTKATPVDDPPKCAADDVATALGY